MKNSNELQKDILCDKVYYLTADLSDDELDYIIYLLNFWKEERKRQENEIRESE